MMDFIQTLFAFILALSILVVVHEWGHFQVAKWLNVKVLRFSVGFGKPLWRKSFGQDKTEFQIAAIPLGGYVKMLDEREGEVAASELSRAFNRQPVWARSLIVLAGPWVNFLFAIGVYTLIHLSGVVGIKPIISAVDAHSLAEQAGLRRGLEIVQVGDKLTPHWQAVRQAILQQRLAGTTLPLTLKDETGKTSLTHLSLSDFSLDDFANHNVFNQLGIHSLKPAAILGEIMPNSPAANAGLQTGDTVVQVDGRKMDDWSAWVEYVRARPLKTLQVTVNRQGQLLTLAVVPENQQGVGQVGVTLGITWPPDHLLVVERYGLLAAVHQALQKTWDMTWLSLQMMAKMVTLEVSYTHISGPVTIAEYAGKTFAHGWLSFLNFLGLVSISLGVINLLPIPMLDGGHLLFYLIETVKGSPLSEMAESIFLRFGISLLLLLMGLAFFNDFNRLLG
jgi:regulator of sigma E protease